MNKNAKLLADFTKYCEAHPEERFWQALRNWSGYSKVFIEDDYGNRNDTFYWNGRTGSGEGV